LNKLLSATSRQRHLPKLVLEHRTGRVNDYARFLCAVYERVVARSGRPGIVESSKSSGYALLLANHPEVELHLVHLVRDPRGPAFSWSRARASPDLDADILPLIKPAVSSFKWVVQNLLIETFLRNTLRERYQLVRYEDLMADPHRVLRRLVAGFGSDPTTLPLAGTREIELGPSHTAGGNQVRFSQSRVALKADLRWRTEMSTLDRLSATIPAIPLLHHYKYPLWVGANHGGGMSDGLDLA
jgi:hypothetical protein